MENKELKNLVHTIAAGGEVDVRSLSPDGEIVLRAYTFAEEVHRAQKRKSGEPSIVHCTEVAKILADLHLDPLTVAAGFLHDVLEDTDVTYSQLSTRFGEEIAKMVDGVTKVSGLHFKSKQAEQVENFRKMFVSMARDVRVILIKFADRLHNMRTLWALSPEKQRQISIETRDIYAPLAHRLGIAKIKWELEDLSLKYLEPEVYKGLEEKINLTRGERENYIEEIKVPLYRELKNAGIEAEITGRPKNFHSLYGKMVRRNKPFEEIYDLFAIRIIVDSVKDCYHALGLVHAMYTPVTERFKDFIATPKSNMYQSLHTTVIGPRGEMVEIQIRTKEMHQIAEEGIAAHWRYKEGKDREDKLDKKLVWFRHLLDWQHDTVDPTEFMEELKINLFEDEIFVFTPKGDLKQLPAGATPLDFAFAVHTDIGFHCFGAKVNGRMVSLGSPLKSGDTVEIITSPAQKPSRDWLNIVKTSKARSRIKRWLKTEEYLHSQQLGQEMLEREFRRKKLKLKEDELLELALAFGIADLEHFFAAIGSGELSPIRVVSKLVQEKQKKELLVPTHLRKEREPLAGIRIQSVKNLMIQLAKCCYPIPGDNIIGFITRGRGVSIHRIDCPNIASLMNDRERTLDVQWDSDREQTFTTQILVLAQDRKNLLNDLIGAISAAEANITSADIRTEEGTVTDRFVLQVKNVQQLKTLIKNLEAVRGVTKVERLYTQLEND
ncbi:MAG TPA: bifunctional (p)ppGpp synthetase/guanosine-3',5'-bis(diphosphate) 3'-pyrophosphohydrolase [Candidatus Latescibacteria bacterium]|nr:bifunctional (p)ppGpp synthetase/guanosine-3',5'-bis(diphosphate) 3'-pyrophosphohydrolase [Candidatus Latescibacterota bacterium]